jgi:hypothetical protein
LVAIGAAFVVRSLRTVVLYSSENAHLWLVTTIFLAVFLLYELGMLRAVTRASQNKGDLPPAAWHLNIALEACIPALALTFLSSGSIEAA